MGPVSTKTLVPPPPPIWSESCGARDGKGEHKCVSLARVLRRVEAMGPPKKGPTAMCNLGDASHKKAPLLKKISFSVTLFATSITEIVLSLLLLLLLYCSRCIPGC